MTRSTALREERLNMQSGVAISISGAYECVPVEVRARCISNYPCHGGSRHHEGDKWNLHVALTGGKTERQRGCLRAGPLYKAINFRGNDAKYSSSAERRKLLPFHSGSSRCMGTGLRA